jgi:hypothetical protein
MGDTIQSQIKSTGKAYARNPASKKLDHVFGNVLNPGSALTSSAKGKSSKKTTRLFPVNVSDAAESALGSLRKDLKRSCNAVGLPFPLLDQFEITFEVEITTGTAIWDLIEANKFWELAQTESLAACRDTIAPVYFGNIHTAGVELRNSLNQYAGLAKMLEAQLPDDILQSLQADIDQFIAVTVNQTKSMRQAIGIAAADSAVEFLATQLKIEKAIFKYRAGKSGIVIIDLGLIAGHIAHMAASFGGTAPLAIIACVRLIIDIGQIAEKAVRDLEGIGKRIDWELGVVKEYWAGKKDDAAQPNDEDEASRKKASTSEKLKANGMEALTSIIAGVTNIDVPSVDALDTLLHDYQHKLNVLTKTFTTLGLN